ncbi:MAG: IS630 family transposase [Opitutales bacterium]
MARKRIKLTGSEACAQVRHWLETNQHVEVRDRLRALDLGFGGQHSYAQIATMVGRSRSAVQEWFGWYRQEGLEGILGHRKGHGGGAPETVNSDAIRASLEEGLKAGKWRTAEQARRDLEAAHGSEGVTTFKYKTVWRWLKNLGGTMRVPRPTHRQKDPEKAEVFKQDFFDKLLQVNVKPNRPIKVWFADEARFGLLPIIRKAWTLRGLRPLAPYATKYQWSYLYGALDVVDGEMVSSITSGVDLPTTEAFLQEICKEFPRHEHIVVWDGAGFHHREDHPDLPPQIHLVRLPPYSPELNPIEKLWDLMQDETCNQLFDDIEQLEEKLTELLEGWWTRAQRVLSLVGNGWQHLQANAT